MREVMGNVVRRMTTTSGRTGTQVTSFAFKGIRQHDHSFIRLCLSGLSASITTPNFLSTHPTAQPPTYLPTQSTTYVQVTDGHAVVAVRNGHSLLTLITAAGCSLTALIAAFIAVAPPSITAGLASQDKPALHPYLLATAHAFTVFG